METDPALPEGRRGAVRIIRESGEHLGAIISGLLDISRIEAGRIELYRDRIRFRSLLEGLAQMMRPQAEAKGLRLVTEWHNLPAWVHADEHRLRQILINLLSNAIKFPRTGEVRFTAGWRAQIAEFTVCDTGPGIAPDDLERIFEPFERAASADVPGTGLGLTITRLLTEILGGEITVSSQPGEGSRFKVRLMLSDVDDPSGEADLPGLGALASPLAGARRRILVVDDDAAHRALMSDLLTPLGFELRCVSDAAGCLAVVAEFRPELFLLDLSMPGTDGAELARRLRGMEAGGAPIIFISGEVLRGQATGYALDTLAGCTVLGKPVELPALLREIGARLGLVGPGRADAPGGNLSASQCAELRALGESGHVRGLRERLDAMEQQSPELGPVIQKLRAPLASYRLEAFRAALDASEPPLS